MMLEVNRDLPPCQERRGLSFMPTIIRVIAAIHRLAEATGKSVYDAAQHPVQEICLGLYVRIGGACHGLPVHQGSRPPCIS
jgi:hypothetical protein